MHLPSYVPCLIIPAGQVTIAGDALFAFTNDNITYKFQATEMEFTYNFESGKTYAVFSFVKNIKFDKKSMGYKINLTDIESGVRIYKGGKFT